MASVASTALHEAVSQSLSLVSGASADVMKGHLFRVTTMRSPRSSPQYSASCSPPQSNSFSRGTMDRNATIIGGASARRSDTIRRPRKLSVFTCESGAVAPGLVVARDKGERDEYQEGVQPYTHTPMSDDAGSETTGGVQDENTMAFALSAQPTFFLPLPLNRAQKRAMPSCSA